MEEAQLDTRNTSTPWVQLVIEYYVRVSCSCYLTALLQAIKSERRGRWWKFDRLCVLHHGPDDDEDGNDSSTYCEMETQLDTDESEDEICIAFESVWIAVESLRLSLAMYKEQIEQDEVRDETRGALNEQLWRMPVYMRLKEDGKGALSVDWFLCCIQLILERVQRVDTFLPAGVLCARWLSTVPSTDWMSQNRFSAVVQKELCEHLWRGDMWTWSEKEYATAMNFALNR